jgi:hypothetical protein
MEQEKEKIDIKICYNLIPYIAKSQSDIPHIYTGERDNRVGARTIRVPKY